jgi:copper chaperone NosL
MKGQLSSAGRIASFICALALIAVIFVPMWRIDLAAPQYPEGLTMKIYPDKVGGDVEIINGLNHYIGMKTIHAHDFVEFTVLPYIIGFFALLGIIVGVTRSRKLFYTFFILFVLFGILAIYDFWRWEYNYGHNLDPNAAIIVPGMSYQPPLLGFKQLLNFGAYSFPDVGGYLFLSVGLILLVTAFLEWRKAKKSVNVSVVLLIGMMLMTQSCSSGPQPISYGKDACDFCKMLISDQKFGAEVITTKGKIFKFDDMHCTVSFIKSNTVEKNDIAAVYFTDFSQKGKLVKSESSFLLFSDSLRSPMGGNVAAFAAEDSLKKFQQQFNGNTVQWSDLIK